MEKCSFFSFFLSLLLLGSQFVKGILIKVMKTRVLGFISFYHYVLVSQHYYCHFCFPSETLPTSGWLVENIRLGLVLGIVSTIMTCQLMYFSLNLVYALRH